MNMHSPFGWTAQRRAAFLASLASCGTVRTAAKSVQLSAQAAYSLRARDPAFARAWDAALAIARDHLVAHLTQVAFEGWTEEVWFRGELVGERTRHNPMVAMRLLERLDRMAGDQAAPIEQFDRLLRAESAGAPIEDPLVRSEADLEEQAADAQDYRRLYHLRDLKRHLDILHAAEPPQTCEHDDCPACVAAIEALCLDPTADIAVSESGGVLGCLYPDDLPNTDVRVGTVYDPWQAERERAAELDALALENYARHQEARCAARVRPVENLATDRDADKGLAEVPVEEPVDAPAFPALECQPVSTCEEGVTTDAGQLPSPEAQPEPADGSFFPVGTPAAEEGPPKPHEKAAPPCEDAAQSVRPDGNAAD